MPDFRFIQCLQNFTLTVDSLTDFKPKFTGDEAFESARHAIRFRTGSPSQFQNIPESACGDQSKSADFSLQQGVGGDRGPVDQDFECRQIDRSRLEGFHDSICLIFWSARNLGNTDSSR